MRRKGHFSEGTIIGARDRHLLYVACLRARDRLMVTGIEPASEFLEDLRRDVSVRAS
jgi:ATP-dependent exoDNAse (exonuclease V) beta subunit